MKKTTKKLQLNVESLRNLNRRLLEDIQGGATNTNGSQRCSMIATCITYVGGCETCP